MSYDECDPGIRDIVRKVNEAGFTTTDSGDGVSKPADWYQPDDHGITEAMPFPHVVATSTPMSLVSDAERLAAVLGAGWTVEATYATHDRIATLLARTLLPIETTSGDVSPDDKCGKAIDG